MSEYEGKGFFVIKSHTVEGIAFFKKRRDATSFAKQMAKQGVHASVWEAEKIGGYDYKIEVIKERLL